MMTNLDVATIRDNRRSGMTFREIADQYGVSHEYIRTLCKDVLVHQTCTYCNNPFLTNNSRSTVCESCRHCIICTNPLAADRLGRDVVCFKCTPRKTSKGYTAEKVETGIYIRVYRSTGEVTPYGYMVYLRDAIGEKCRWQRFETLEQARQARADAIADGRLRKKKGNRKKRLDKIPY